MTADAAAALVARLMVLAELLTYRRDVPQKGRAAIKVGVVRPIDVRVSVMPTTHHMRAAASRRCRAA